MWFQYVKTRLHMAEILFLIAITVMCKRIKKDIKSLETHPYIQVRFP